MKLYAQMYSVREDCDKDFKQALAKIAEIGYQGVELAGRYGMTPEALADYLKSINLEVLSAHVGLDLLQNELESEIIALKILGAKYIVCPWAEIHSVKDAIEHAALLNDIGRRCKDNGLTLLYHNHAHELVNDNNQYPLDVLFENVNPELVKQQVDVYWVEHAGLHALDYVEANADRIEIVHLKQLQNMITKKNVAAAEGVIDFNLIMEAVPEAKFIYEQEFSDTSVMADMAESFTAIVG